MRQPFILSCESTVDLPYSYVSSRGIPVLFYSYTADEKEYPDDMGRDPDALPAFYKLLETRIPQTSQLNVWQYVAFFEPLLEKSDVLHIAFGSGMTNSVTNAFAAATLLKEKYPHRRLEIIDSFCSSSGYGLLVDCAADLWDQGKTMDQVSQWTRTWCKRVHHQFFSTDLKYFRRSGRVSGAAATVGAILSICPIMRLNNEGRIIAYDKVRGKEAAIQRTVKTMEAHAVGGVDYDKKCFICHSNCLGVAEKLAEAVSSRFPLIPGGPRICDIGTIIASHCGPGTVAVFFFGDERAPGEKG